jgi:hypothetical protein
MGKISLKDNMLIVKEGMGKYTSLPLDALRLLYIFFPGNFKWYVVASSQNIEGYNLDSLPEDAFSRVTAEFKEKLLTEKTFILKDVKLCLADYANHSTVISLNDVKKSKVDLFDKLLLYRKPRVDKLNQWLTTYPEVRLEGGLGAKAFVNKEGFRKGDNKFIPWNQVGTIQIVEKNFGLSDLLIIPQGVGTGIYSLKKYRYSLGNISTKKKELYIAECNFWRTMEAEQEDIPEQIKELSQLKEQGILTEEKFNEAKKKLLAEI